MRKVCSVCGGGLVGGMQQRRRRGNPTDPSQVNVEFSFPISRRDGSRPAARQQATFSYAVPL